MARTVKLRVGNPTMDEVNLFISGIYGKNLVMPPVLTYKALYVNNLLVGILTLAPRDDGKEIHLSMVKKMRHLARKFVQFVVKNEKRVYADIPLDKTSVINAAKKCGFTPLRQQNGKQLLCLTQP